MASEKSFDYPQTVIIRHPKERRKRCTVWPLKGREDVRVLTLPAKTLPPLEGYIRLAASAPPLSEADADYGILLLDCCWRRAEKMLARFDYLPARSLQGWRSAFPRAAKYGTDPENGLASIEALFAAYHLLHRPTKGLLDDYLWGKEFLEINGIRDNE